MAEPGLTALVGASVSTDDFPDDGQERHLKEMSYNMHSLSQMGYIYSCMMDDQHDSIPQGLQQIRRFQDVSIILD